MSFLPISALFTPATPTEWLANFLTNDEAVELPTTSWQAGGVTRTILAIMANIMGQEDGAVSLMNQAGFLDYSASGVVSYVANNGQTVTVAVSPDPSVEGANPDASPTWLDVLAFSRYNVIRIPAKRAQGAVDIVNTTSNTYGPFAPGTYHVTNPTSGQGYSNVEELTVNASDTTTATFQADLIGVVGTAAAGFINEPVTTLAGVTASNPEALVGQNYESNQGVASRCRLKLQSLSPNGPRGAYEYFALTAYEILAAQTPPVTMGQAITRAAVMSSAATGVVTTIIANASGPVDGVANLAITNATNASPIAITTIGAHGLSTGANAIIKGVVGNAAANGTWKITVTGASTFTLDGSVGDAGYTTSGVVEGGDLGLVDAVIQANVVPDGSATAITLSAAEWDVAIVATVRVPAAYVGAYTISVQVAIALYFASLPIGGNSNTLDIEVISGILVSAGTVSGLNQASYVVGIDDLTINGVSTDVAYPSPTSIATLSPAPSIVVMGV